MAATTGPAANLRVFVSSTFSGLQEHRQPVFDALQALGIRGRGGWGVATLLDGQEAVASILGDEVQPTSPGLPTAAGRAPGAAGLQVPASSSPARRDGRSRVSASAPADSRIG